MKHPNSSDIDTAQEISALKMELAMALKRITILESKGKNAHPKSKSEIAKDFLIVQPKNKIRMEFLPDILFKKGITQSKGHAKKITKILENQEFLTAIREDSINYFLINKGR